MITQERFIELSERYLNGSLEDAEAGELFTAIQESAEFRELLRVQAAMHAVITRRFRRMGSAVGKRVRAALRDPTQKKGAITRIMEKLEAKRSKKKEPLVLAVRKREAPRSRRTFFLAAATAAAALVAVMLLVRAFMGGSASDPNDAAWKIPAGAAVVADATPQSGHAVVTRNGVSLVLRKQRSLIAGDAIATAEADTVALVYPDKTEVKVSAKTTLALQPETWKDTAGIALDLSKGAIDADVAPQTAGRPFVVATQYGHAQVVGTRFKLTADATESRLDVTEGKVSLTNALKKETVLVEKGQSAVASSSAALEAVASTRDPALWPFNAKSPWNYPMGSDAKFVPIESPRFDPAKGAELVADAGAIPIVIASAADPMRVVYRNDKAAGKQLRVPLDAKPDPSKLHLLDIIDEIHFKVYEFMDTEIQADGSIKLGHNSYYNSIRHMGVFDNDKQHGTRTYGGSSLGGVIRKGELKGGIRHALGVGTLMAALNKNTPSGKPYVWPASHAIELWEQLYGSTGNLYMGSLLAIPPNVDIRTIGVGTSGPAYEIARALQDYGAYIIEHFEEGPRDLKIYFEPAAKSEIPQGLEAQMARIIRHLRVVTNNAPHHIGGGGAPRRAFAPPFAAEYNSTPDAGGQF